MKYKKLLDQIAQRGVSREKLRILRENATRELKAGNQDAESVIDALDQATPTDQYVVFMGFCPDANFENRLDIDWRRESVCTYIYYDDEKQTERFDSIHVRDLVILKKRQRIGKTMQLFGYGRVTGIKYDPDDHRYLTMNWSSQDEIIEVPLMGCNSTVDIKSTDAVYDAMPDTFYKWLGVDRL